MDNLKIITAQNGNFLINNKFKDCLDANNIKSAESLMKLKGVTVKKVLKERGTEKVILKSTDGKKELEMFLKRYLPVPLKEIYKGIVSLKKTNFNAFDEWNSILSFHQQQLDTMEPVAIGKVNKECCILTLGIKDYTKAPEVFKKFQNTPEDDERKRKLIISIAEYVGKMHKAGMAHQDLYLVHFFIKEQEHDRVFLIDLQRALVKKEVAWRWRVKDLGQLLFSAKNFINQNEIDLFWENYCRTANHNLKYNSRLIKAILKKAQKILNREIRKSKE